MKAIIIEDKDCQALVDKLEMQKTSKRFLMVSREGVDENTLDAIYNDVHRSFHYQVVRWLQDQGWKS